MRAKDQEIGLKVPFVDLAAQHRDLMPELTAALERVIADNGFILGEELERFEEEFASYCGARHCVGVSSGTAAITLALRAAGIGPGDEVVVPAHTYVATAFAARIAGAVVVFCDVDAGTGLIDPDACAAAITRRTAAIIPVHLYGQTCEMDRLRQIADRDGLLMLEDSAQAHGATFAGARVGSLGAAGAFSFYPSKNLGALGDGGAITTDDGELAGRARALRNLGQRRKGVHEAIASNDRLDGIQAAFLRAKLPHLDRWNERRREHAREYTRLLGTRVPMLPERENGDCTYHLFPVRVADRDACAARLQEEGIGVGIHYSPTAAWQAPFLPAPDCPAADRWQREELSLPMFPELDEAQIAAVTGSLLRLLDGP